MSHRTSGSDRGSVLVDALVAIGIMAITLTLAAEVVGDGARRTRASELSRLGVLEARSRLAEVGADIALVPGKANGEDGDLVWSVDIAPAPSGGPQQLLAVTVKVFAREGGAELASLHSLQVSP